MIQIQIPKGYSKYIAEKLEAKLINNENIGYKVVTLELRSILAQGKYSLQYLPETTVHSIPGTLGIFIFKSLLDAKTWVKTAVGKGIILKVRFDPKTALRTRIVSGSASEYFIDDFYGKQELQDYIHVPPGTILVPWVNVESLLWRRI